MKDNTSNKSDSWKYLFNGWLKPLNADFFNHPYCKAGVCFRYSTDDEEQHQADHRNTDPTRAIWTQPQASVPLVFKIVPD